MAALVFELPLSEVERRLVNLADRLTTGNHPDLLAALRQAAARYLAYIRKRFDTLSKGGGEWPDLSVSTKMARARARQSVRKALDTALAGIRKKEGKATRAQAVQGLKFAILRDTNLLFGSLTLGGPSNLFVPIPDGIRAGTAVYYGRHHQSPSIPGRPPVRRILVPPDADTAAAMTDDVARGASRAIQKELTGG